jgi:hypothetical protein
VRWNRHALADVYRDVPRVDSRFEHTHLGVFPAATEEPRRFHTEISVVFLPAVDDDILVPRFCCLLF